ncbi:single-stranded DNA-binding protein [bacterium]|nr:single-stranded DNA-binding protein [bacterium]
MSARSLNKVLLIGNLTRDPDCRYTPNQTLVCSFGLATNREWSSSNGEKQSSVEYHNLVVWSRLAEICRDYLHKGNKIYVEGRLQTRDWQGKDGVNRRTTEVIVENMIMLSAKGEGRGSYDGGYGGDNMGAPASKPVEAAPVSEPAAEEVDVPVDDDSDIPF